MPPYVIPIVLASVTFLLFIAVLSLVWYCSRLGEEAERDRANRNRANGQRQEDIELR
jgi:hypothetical protein